MNLENYMIMKKVSYEDINNIFDMDVSQQSEEVKEEIFKDLMALDPLTPEDLKTRHLRVVK